MSWCWPFTYPCMEYFKIQNKIKKESMMLWGLERVQEKLEVEMGAGYNQNSLFCRI